MRFPFGFLVCILLCFLCVQGEEVSICDTGNLDLICEVTTEHDFTSSQNFTFSFSGKGSILIKCVNSTCGRIVCSKPECNININVNGSVVMENDTRIHTSSLFIRSYSILIKNNAIIDVSSLGFIEGPGHGDSTTGASYGGSGGRDIETMFCYATSQTAIIGNPFNESESFLYGSGTGRRGGGRVWLSAEQISVLGVIAANGDNGDFRGAGASGGTIILQAPIISISEDAQISAIGGMGNPVLRENSWKYGGGGGGRIFLRYENLECSYYDAIIAFGGPSNGGTRGLIGGAGTITHFITTGNVTNSYIVIDNRDLKSTAGTPLSFFGFPSVAGISIQRTAVVFSSPIIITSQATASHLNKGVNVKNSKLLPLDEEQGLQINASDVTLLSNSLLSATKNIVLNCSSFRSSQSTIKFEGNLQLYATEDIHIDGSIVDEYTSSDSFIHIETNGPIEITGAINAQFVHIISFDSITVEGGIKSQRSDCISTDVFRGSYSEFLANRTLFDTNATQHYIYLIAPTVTLEMKSKIEGGTIFICSETATINGILDADGDGCPSGRGLSPGHASSHPYGCAGGGGYGGQGGRGGEPHGGEGGAECGNRDYPLLMGSGGGSVSQSGGNGGGVILIESVKLTVLNKAELIADGSAATSETSGGGSGGSILLSSQYLTFHGYAHANGGMGGENGGGGGGGGRIMFVLNATLVEEGLFSGNYSVRGGSQGSHDHRLTQNEHDGADGSIWTSLAPCKQGRGTVFCTICPPGSYKSEAGVSNCSLCTNGPLHSVYTMKGYTDENCPYQCLPGYRGHDCLTPFYEFLRQLGGPLVLFFILTIFVIIVLVVILLLSHYNKLRLQQYKQLELSLPSAWYAQDIDRMRQKQKTDSHYLTNSTLCQHVGRIYLNGRNSFSDPWQVPEKPPEELVTLIYIPEYESFRDELNTKLRHNTCGDMLVIIISLIIFPPLTFYFYNKVKKDKARMFEEYIARGNHLFLKGPRAQALQECVKCGYDDHFSVAYIDILYNENGPAPEGLVVGSPSLPLLIPVSGDGSLLRPFTIDISDVLVSSIPNCKDLLKFIDREFFIFLSQLNRFLRSIPPFSIHSRDDITEIRECTRDIMNLFHYNNTHYQYLISAGLQLDLVIAWPNTVSSSTTVTPGGCFLSLLVSHHHAVNPGHLPRRHEQGNSLKSRNSKRLSRDRSNQSSHRDSIYSSSDSLYNSAEKSSIRDKALARRENEQSIDSLITKKHTNMNMLYDTFDPVRLVYLTQPFAKDQVQLSRSFSSSLYRLLFTRPVAPSSMNLRLVVKYALAVFSLLDVILVLSLNVNMWCSDLHHNATCSPIAVFVSYLIFPFSILVAPLASLAAALTHFYQASCYSLLLHFLSVFPILSMLVFVWYTPYVGKAVLSILLLLVIKFIEKQLLLSFIAILETKEKIEVKKKNEREYRRTFSTSDLGLKRVPSGSSMGKVILPRYNELADLDLL